MTNLTPKQLDLARHALGLDGSRKVSYRNRYVVGSGSTDHEEWLAMCAAGLAQQRAGSSLPFGGMNMFWLTLEGAHLALRKGERLDKEDFPEK